MPQDDEKKKAAPALTARTVGVDMAAATATAFVISPFIVTIDKAVCDAAACVGAGQDETGVASFCTYDDPAAPNTCAVADDGVSRLQRNPHSSDRRSFLSR